MSCTEIYGIKKDGTVEEVGETRNSFRGAMAIWHAMEEKYLPPFKPAWAKNDNEKYHRHSGSDMQAVWGIYKAPKTSREDNIVLASTYDRVIVLSENIPELLKCFRGFESETSLKEQADIIEEKSNDYIGFCWNQTSVDCGVWESSNRYELDENDDKEYLPYNIFKDDDHWDLFQDLMLIE